MPGINQQSFYLCVDKIFERLIRLRTINILIMKNKLYAVLMIILLAVVVSSCYSSRKSGCPMNPQSNYKFKG